MSNALVNEFLNRHPAVETIELVVTDPSGIARGKWAPVGALHKAFEEGVNFPLSLHGLDVWGNEVPDTGFHISSGDRDGFFRAVPESLSVVPWGGGEQSPNEASNEQMQRAQVLLETWTPGGKPFGACSRQVLRAALERARKKGLRPTVAFELEFHLVENGPDGIPRPLDGEVVAGGENQFMYDLSALAEHTPLFDTIRSASTWAELPIDTIIKEAAPGQFEINLHHREDALHAADDVILLKRIVQNAASAHGLRATFMAKPFAGQPGNGMHVHMSVLGDDGRNIFAGEDGKKHLIHAVAGLVSRMPESTLLFLNSVNGFRRLAPGSYAPTRANWGQNNRSVAVRIPAGPDAASRVEHRVSGADANPYLVLAAILQAALEGLDEASDPPGETTGNAYDLGAEDAGPLLPANVEDALVQFEASSFVKRALGETMAATYAHLKRAEIERFRADISPFELASYL